MRVSRRAAACPCSCLSQLARVALPLPLSTAHRTVPDSAPAPAPARSPLRPRPLCTVDPEGMLQLLALDPLKEGGRGRVSDRRRSCCCEGEWLL